MQVEAEVETLAYLVLVLVEGRSEMLFGEDDTMKRMVSLLFVRLLSLREKLVASACIEKRRSDYLKKSK